MQTRTGNDPNGPGNCFSACVASVLECDLAELPDEAEIVKRLKVEFAGQWESWPDRFKWGKSWAQLWVETNNFLRGRGLAMLEVQGPFLSEMPDVYSIVSGKSPRGLEHACVGRGLEIVHDPHPDGGGVADERTYVIFVAIDPAQLKGIK